MNTSNRSSAHGKEDDDVDGACGHAVLMLTVMTQRLNQCSRQADDDDGDDSGGLPCRL